MTKRTKTNKSLRLSTETVRRMSVVRRVGDDELKQVAGGPAEFQRPSIGGCLTLWDCM